MVGVLFPDWSNEVFELTKTLGRPHVLLYSFELKKYLDFSNLREAFFQAVSNSSWANEGYLVVAEMAEDGEFEEELQRLSNSFGIGLIKLDLNDPDSSEVIFPAKRKENIDWETVNKLYEGNKDFRNFIKGVYNDLKTNEIRHERYDKLYDPRELVKILRK